MPCIKKFSIRIDNDFPINWQSRIGMNKKFNRISIVNDGGITENSGIFHPHLKEKKLPVPTDPPFGLSVCRNTLVDQIFSLQLYNRRKFRHGQMQKRKAVARLAEDKLVKRRPGAGTTVSGRGESAPLKFFIDSAGVYSPWYRDVIVQAAAKTAEGAGHQLFQFNSTQTSSSDLAESNGIILFNIDDDIRMYEDYTKLAQKGIPVVLLNRNPQTPFFSVFYVDYYQETYKVIDRMIRNGARRIVYCGPQTHFYMPLRPRFNAWRQAYLDNRLPDPVPELAILNTFPDSQAHYDRLLQSGTVDVVFIPAYGNFTFAAGRAIRAGLRIPEDIRLVCFDNMEKIGEDIGIVSSYIRLPLETIASRAVEYLLTVAGCKEKPPVRMQFECSVVVTSNRFLI